MLELKESIIVSEEFDGTSKDDIRTDVLNKIYEVAQETDWGYLDQDEIDEFLMPQVEVTDTDDGRVRVEVRAEYFDYDAQRKMGEALDEIIRKYDADAYFDDEDIGIMSAYLDVESNEDLNEDADSNRYATVNPDSKELSSPEDSEMIRSLNKMTEGIANRVRANQDTKEMTRRSIQIIGNYVQYYKDHPNEIDDSNRDLIKDTEVEYNKLKSEFEETYGSSLGEAYYGGAYDIDPEMYFTRDDYVEFANQIIDEIAEDEDVYLELDDINVIDNKHVRFIFFSPMDTYTTDVYVDYRRVRKPSDLYRYLDSAVKDIKNKINEYRGMYETLQKDSSYPSEEDVDKYLKDKYEWHIEKTGRYIQSDGVEVDYYHIYRTDDPEWTEIWDYLDSLSYPHNMRENVFYIKFPLDADSEGLQLKLDEAIDDFEEYSGNITYNAYKTVADMRKYLKAHPDSKSNINALRKQVSDIYAKAYLESLQESLEGEDGWGDDVGDLFYDFFGKIDRLSYEIRNTVRGAETGAKTVSGLVEYLESLQEELDDIIGNLEESEDVLEEDLVPDNLQSALDAVISNYGTTTEPYKGPSFILPDGSYLDTSKVTNHSDVEYWLDQNGLSIKADYNRRSGSPTLRSLGCIRVDTPKYYIQLPENNITSAQYDALKDWIEFAFTECNVPFIEVIATGTSPVRYQYEDDVDANYIVDRIRRYYITNHLYEAHEDLAEGPYLKEDKEKVNFKDVHLCQGCGKPLSQCTCEVKEEESDKE